MPDVECLLVIDEVIRRTSLSQRELYRRIKEGSFPQPIRLGAMPNTGRGGRVAWVESEIDGWIRAQIKAWREDRGPEVPVNVRGAYAEREIEKSRVAERTRRTA